MRARSTRHRLLRWSTWCVLAVAVLAVLAVVGVEVALKTRTVRDALVGRIVPWVQQNYDVGVEVEDFSLSLVGGVLEVRGLVLRSGAAEPFARVDRVRAAWKPTSLLSGNPRVRELVVERPVVDLGMPLPKPPEKDPSESPSELALRIERIRVTEASLDAGVPEGLAGELRAWRVRGGDIAASLDGDRFAVSAATAAIGVDLVRAGALDLEVAVEADGKLGGDVEVRRARVSGAPLDVEASGRVGAGERDISGSFVLRTDAGFWLGEPATAPVRVEGDVDLAAWTGTGRIRAPEVPGPLFRGLVAAEDFDRLEMAATSFALETDVELVETDGVAAQVRLAAARDGGDVLRISAAPRLRLLEALPLTGEISVELLPELVGARRVTAAVEGDDVRRPEEWTLTRGTVALDSPDVDGLLAAVARLWPRLLPAATLADLPVLGKLAATGTFSGAVTDPELESRIDWRPHADALVRADVSGHLRGADLELQSEGSNLSLAHFTDGASSGRLEWSGSVHGGLENPQGGIHAAIWGLASGGETLFDALDVRVSGNRRALEWALDGSSPTFGSLEGAGSVVPESILARGGGRLTMTPVAGAVEGVDLFESTFELAGGALVLEARGFGAGREIAAIDARMPLAEVARIPGAEAVATLPLLRSEGRVELEWRIPTGDWAWLVPEAWRDRVGRLEAGSSGRVELDVACPACSRASGEILGLSAMLDGRSISSDEPLALSLADGRMSLARWAAHGEELALSIEGEADLDTAWRPGSDPAELVTQSRVVVDGELGSSWLEGLPLEVVTPGTARLHIEAGGPATDWSGRLDLSAETLVVASPSLPGLPIAGPRAGITLAAGEVTIDQLEFGVGEGSLTAEGRLRLEDPLRDASGRVRLTGGLPVVEQIELPFEIRDGLLSVFEGAIATPGGSGKLDFRMPLTESAGTTAQVGWSVPRNDWKPLLGLFGGGEDPESLQFGSRGEIEIDLESPADATATIVLDEAEISMRGRTTLAETPIELTLAEARLTVAPFTLTSDAGKFVFNGQGDLARGWTTGEPFAELVSRFELEGHGAIDSGLLNPFLAGGRASGPLKVDLSVAGSPSDYAGRVLLAGPEAEFLYRSPYLTRLTNPQLELAVNGSRVTVERGSGVLNEGTLRLAGVLAGEGGTDLEIRIDDALFRLDYGLLTKLDGDVRYRAGTDGTALVSGGVTVERGSLTRSIQLDYDLLTQLLAPIDLTTTEDDPLELVLLDLEVRTREGVRVKNNVGDLLVRWEPLAVTGSLARPIIEGRVEVDPGGLLYAYGQTVRLDRATIEYPGGEDAEPRLDFEATTSLDDPTIGQLSGGDPFREATVKDDSAGPAAGEVTADLARYYGEQFAGRIGESVGVSVSLRPLLIFGETDPGARLTVSRDLSPTLALAASVDLRQAEGQTYLLELHEMRRLPRLVAQGFTDDSSAYGGALLQRQEFGGSRASSDLDLPRISKLVVDPPPGVSRRGIKRGLGLEKGDRFDSQQRFVAEVELVEYLMNRGYPDARVSVLPVSEGRRDQKVRLEVDIQSGPHVAFRFQGEKIGKPLRAIIGSLYRPDFFEPESIEEMRVETIRALRSRGFLQPEVEISVQLIDPSAPQGDRLVVVTTTGGVKMSLEPPVFLGVPTEDAEVLRIVFSNAVQRVELAVGQPSADRRLIKALADLGYPRAAIVTRYQSLETGVLTVELEPGPRQRIAAVEIAGVSEETLPGLSATELEALLAVADGDPLRRVRLSRSVLAVERDLGSRGYLDARVRTILAQDESDEFATTVTFLVEPGTQSRLGEVEFTGLRSTNERWARKVTALEPGASLARDDLSRARTNLWRTGLFRGVSAETIESEPGVKRVVFDLAERSRYRLTYGVRWDSDDGMGAVVDATDDNFLGRSWSLGLRALHSNVENSLRWLTRVPRAFGGKGTLEFFAAIRELSTTVFLGPIFGTVEVPIDRLEGTLQYSHPVGEKTTVRTYVRYSDETQTFPFTSLQIRNPQLGVQYVYDSRGPEPLTERGIFASVDLSGTGEFLGGDLTYARMFSQFNLYRPAGRVLGKKLTWSQSFRLGLTETFDQVLINSRDVRFFAGGEYSVRGYATESLGPPGAFGPTGGGALSVVNQELRWRALTDYVLVLFFDAGNVWEDSGDLLSDLVTSAGIGLRAQTPVGLLRLDLARPFDPRIDIDPEYKIYFGIGTTF